MGQIKSPKSKQNNVLVLTAKGQVALEYILLLVVAVGIAMVMIRSLVYRSTDSPGVVIKAWQQMIEAIGEDTADMPNNPNPNP